MQLPARIPNDAGTNWDHALFTAHQGSPDLTLFITDGQPNRIANDHPMHNPATRSRSSQGNGSRDPLTTRSTHAEQHQGPRWQRAWQPDVRRGRRGRSFVQRVRSLPSAGRAKATTSRQDDYSAVTEFRRPRRQPQERRLRPVRLDDARHQVGRRAASWRLAVYGDGHRLQGANSFEWKIPSPPPPPPPPPAIVSQPPSSRMPAGALPGRPPLTGSSERRRPLRWGA